MGKIQRSKTEQALGVGRELSTSATQARRR
jgi:hypothetical protein